MKTSKVFGFLLLTIFIQEFINRTLDDYFIVGIAPTLIFGIKWNLSNGHQIYSKLQNKRDFNIKAFRALSVWSIVWVLVYMMFLNLFLWPPGIQSQSLSKSLFLPISSLTAIFPLYALYYNINFVTKGLMSHYNDKGLKLGAILALIFFPIGLFWIQPKIHGLSA